MNRRRTSILALVAMVWAMTGCAAPLPPFPPSPTIATKSGDGVVHHDLAPLATRVPALATATAVTWTSGTMGDGRAPGPSTYWIDAVVTLDQVQADHVRSGLTLAPVSRPTLAAPVDGAVPAGPLLGSDELNRRYAPDNWSATAYLTAEGSTLILQLMGGN